MDIIQFRRLVVRAKMLAHGDSNDSEIEALQDVVHAACVLVGLDDNVLNDEAYAAAEAKGWC